MPLLAFLALATLALALAITINVLPYPRRPGLSTYLVVVGDLTILAFTYALSGWGSNTGWFSFAITMLIGIGTTIGVLRPRTPDAPQQ